MLFPIIQDLSHTISKELYKISDYEKAFLFNNVDKMRVVKYFCAIKEFGPGIMEWELETFEIVLGRKGYSYQDIMDIVYMVYVMKNEDYVLTNRDHFENAVQILNDDLVDVDSTEYHAPHKIVWAIVLLMALYNVENLPVFGDALEYIAESFQNFGWTQPPLFFANNDKFNHLFPYFDSSFVKEANTSLDRLWKLSSEIKHPQNALENYYKMHLPIVEYVKEKSNTLQGQIKEIAKA